MCVHGLRLCWTNSAITYWWGPDWVYTCTPTSIYTFPLFLLFFSSYFLDFIMRFFSSFPLIFFDFIMGCNERNEYERGETKSN